MSREKLNTRRDAILFEFDHGGVAHTLGVGFYDDVEKTRVAEVFIDCHKRATGMADNARDAATVCSIALQHGAPLLTIYTALNRYEDGEAAGVLGSALDTLKREMPDLFVPVDPVDNTVSRAEYDSLVDQFAAQSDELQQAKDEIAKMEECRSDDDTAFGFN